MLVLFLVFSYISLFLEEFVVPIMYLRRCRAIPAWREFSGLFKAHRGAFILFGLFAFLLSIVFGILLLTGTLATCCLLLLLLALPWINAVVLLPVSVWWRAFSLEFLRQAGADYDLWLIPPPPPL